MTARALSTRAAPVGERGDAAPQLHVTEMQRARLLAAAATVIDELGYAGVTVTHITARARVSRRTYYELFSNCEDCLTAVMEDGLRRVLGEIARAESDGMSWRERIRRGLEAMLSFFDREPALARVCVVQSLRGSEAVLARRVAVLGRLASAVDTARAESPRAAEAPPLTAEGIVGAAHAIVYARLLERSSKPLVGLLGDLMGMVVLPYFGPAASRRERARPATPQRRVAPAVVSGEREPVDLFEGVSMRLTYRTARVLECIEHWPGISNRMVSDRAGIPDQGQASKLLARLERLGLAANTGKGHAKGAPNAWHLTPTGAQVTRHIHAFATHNDRAPHRGVQREVSL